MPHGENGSLLAADKREMSVRQNGFSWWLEIIALFVALIAFFAIIATLYPHQGKPLPQWPFNISINTLLSIYTFVMKAALPVVVNSCLAQLQWTWFVVERPLIDVVRYDAAAKGPLGSVQWLWANHVSQPLTALAAVIVIISIIIDPFVQQLVVYKGCSTALLGVNASIPRTNYFLSDGYHIGALLETVDFGVQSAIAAGLFGSPDLVDASCSTGNCTFPNQYATVGYCSACQNITSQINTTVEVIIGSDNNTWIIGNPEIMTSTLPSGLSNTWNGTIGGNITVFASAGTWPESQFSMARHISRSTALALMMVTTSSAVTAQRPTQHYGSAHSPVRLVARLSPGSAYTTRLSRRAYWKRCSLIPPRTKRGGSTLVPKRTAS
jgi:Protein of unknown function (DUF3176)